MSLTRCCGQPKSVLAMSPVFVPKPITEFSLAGVQPKVSAQLQAEIKCTHCGWWAVGRVTDGVVENGAFVSGQFEVLSSRGAFVVE